MIKKLILIAATLILLASCKNADAATETGAPADTSGMEFTVDLTKAESYSDEVNAVIIFGDTVSLEGKGVGANGNAVTIAESGTYKISGSGKGSITVEAGEKDDIYLVLEDLSLENPDGPAIVISEADNVYIVAGENTENTVSDGSSYEVSVGDSTADAAIFSKADLTLSGKGKLTVNGNYKHGVVSKDDLVVGVAELCVSSKNVGLNGKDCVKISDAKIEITAGSDGVRSDNTEDTSRGYIYIENTTLTVDASNDGVQAETVLSITGGTYNVTAGGGSSSGLSSSSESYKGLKAGSDIYISGGTFEVQSKDDCIHANNDIYISGGKFTLSSGDDGIHGDNKLDISGGAITVEKSYEGLEATYITISGGTHDITASDDGLNAAGGNDSSSMGGRPGQGGFSQSTGEIVISNGYIKVDASGDGIDSNGTFTLSGGEVYVSGPENSGNGAFDYDSSATVTGGTLVALGESGMAQGFSSAENQGAMLVNFTTQRGASFSVLDSDGNVIVSFDSDKKYSSAVVTSPEIQAGETYTVVCDGVTVATVKMTDNLNGSSSGMNPGGGMGGNQPGDPGMNGRPGGKYF